VQHLGELNSIFGFNWVCEPKNLQAHYDIDIKFDLFPAMKGLRVPTVPLKKKKDQEPKFLAEKRRISTQYVITNFLSSELRELRVTTSASDTGATSHFVSR
jgi:hypothetical protein